jgi:hypothetical protein
MILWFVRNLRPVYRSVRFRNFPGTLASRPVPGIWPVWGTGCPDRNPERCDRQLSTSERDFPDRIAAILNASDVKTGMGGCTAGYATVTSQPGGHRADAGAFPGR